MNTDKQTLKKLGITQLMNKEKVDEAENQTQIFLDQLKNIATAGAQTQSQVAPPAANQENPKIKNTLTKLRVIRND